MLVSQHLVTRTISRVTHQYIGSDQIQYYCGKIFVYTYTTIVSVSTLSCYETSPSYRVVVVGDLNTGLCHRHDTGQISPCYKVSLPGLGWPGGHWERRDKGASTLKGNTVVAAGGRKAAAGPERNKDTDDTRETVMAVSSYSCHDHGCHHGVMTTV